MPTSKRHKRAAVHHDEEEEGVEIKKARASRVARDKENEIQMNGGGCDKQGGGKGKSSHDLHTRRARTKPDRFWAQDICSVCVCRFVCTTQLGR